MFQSRLRFAVQCILLLALVAHAEAYAFATFGSPAQPARWNINGAKKIAWTLAPGAPVLLREAMLFATQEWSTVTDQRLQFVEGAGGIEVFWDESGQRIPDQYFLAYASFLTGADTTIDSGTIVVNAKNYSWRRGAPYGVGGYVGDKRDAELDQVILHELGHLLGLDHSDKARETIVGVCNSIDTLPTMNSIIYPGAESLHDDDIAGARSLYAGTGTGLHISGSPASGVRAITVYFSQNSADQDTVWDFGDGQTTTGAAPIHRFTAPGIYTVAATLNGQQSTLTIEVLKKAPRAKPAPKKAGKNPKRAPK